MIIKMKFLYLPILFFAASCGQTKNKAHKQDDTKIDTTKDFTLTDKSIKFLWRDSISSIVINESYCKTISDPEKAALGFVATFIGNECSWDGEHPNNDRSNLKCEILTALNLGYQCSDKHLGFLKQWFKNDTASLQKLATCPTIPNTSNTQETFDEIIITTKQNEISIFFKASGINLREERDWTWSETNYFKVENEHIKLIKQDKSKVIVTHFDAGS
jgi:hypothetical protein